MYIKKTFHFTAHLFLHLATHDCRAHRPLSSNENQYLLFMKKNLLLLLGLAGSIHLSAQLFTVKNLNFPVQHADVSAIDIDRDGDRDLVISGDGNDGARIIQVFLNDGAGNFTATTSPFMGAGMATIDWGDVNNDGRTDMVQSGFNPAPYAGLFTSNATNTFSASTMLSGLPQMAPSIGIADLNNDGYDDIYVFGNKFEGKSKLFFNNKMGGFTESAQFEAYNWIDPQVTEVDYDKDGDIDLFITAGAEASVPFGSDGGRFSRMFVNNNGTFTELDLGLLPKGFGSADWGDYDGDGYPDLLLNGDGYNNSGEDADNYRLYRNNAGTFTAITTFGNHRQISVGDGGRFADFDNDGDMDVIVTGWTGTRQATSVYLNAAGVFTEFPLNASLPGVSESSIEVSDVDGDTDLDLLLTGYSGNEFAGAGSAYNNRVSLVVINPNILPNVAPTAPTGLAVSGNMTALTFSWNPGTDLTTPQNSLSYNLFVIDENGKWYMFPLADTTNGSLMLQRMGNVQLNRSWILKGLPAGNYRWGVQAIDNSFMGSPFTMSTFTINNDGTLPVRLSNYSVVAEGRKVKIEWTTASEQNNNRFEIERSADGISFSKLAEIKGKGTTANETQYQLFDHNPVNGTGYYRLIQYNNDGRSTNYGVKKVSLRTTAQPFATIYPNPIRAGAAIRLHNYSQSNITVSLLDMMGRLVERQQVATSENVVTYPLIFKNKPAKGLYTIILSGNDFKQTISIKID